MKYVTLVVAAAATALATPAMARTRTLMTPPATYKVTFEDVLISSYNTCAGAASYKLTYIKSGDGSVLKTKTGSVASKRSFTDTLAGGLAANTTLVIKLEHACADGTDKPPLATVTMGRRAAPADARLGNFEIQD
jgi:hypothetical protein